MTGKPVVALLSDLGIYCGHSRLHVSNHNFYSEVCFQTFKYHLMFLEHFFHHYNHKHRHSGSGAMQASASFASGQPQPSANDGLD